jgi:hypothetical protein
MEQHPNKLLEAYNSLPENAMPEKPEAALSEETETDAGASGATEEINPTSSPETENSSRESKSNT